MISREDLGVLAGYRPRPGSPVLSVYLDVDQSRPANLNRGFERTLKHLLRAIEPALPAKGPRAQFAADADRVIRFVANYAPGARTLAMFCDDSEGFFLARELQARLPSQARWRDTPWLRPLLEALDQFARYGVILTDRAHARLFTVALGEIQEHAEAFAASDVRHIKTTGTDHVWSQKHIQRKADVHAGRHLKHVAGLVDHLAAVHRFDRLVLAGPEEATGELRRLLPPRLRSRLAGTLAVPVPATPEQVLEAVRRLDEELERAEDLKTVDDLITAASKTSRAVTGAAATLAHLRPGRVWRLVYAEGDAPRGWRCPRCPALFAADERTCPHCGEPLQATDDLVESAAARVIETGGQVEAVRGEAAARLRAVGGMGGYLRF